MGTIPSEGDGVLIFDDTGFEKQGRHSVGVARQYTGTVGKLTNCQVTVDCQYAERTLAWPVATRWYLPREWADDADAGKRRTSRRRARFRPKINPVCSSPSISGIAVREPVAITALRVVMVRESTRTLWGERKRAAPCSIVTPKFSNLSGRSCFPTSAITRRIRSITSGKSNEGSVGWRPNSWARRIRASSLADSIRALLGTHPV